MNLLPSTILKNKKETIEPQRFLEEIYVDF